MNFYPPEFYNLNFSVWRPWWWFFSIDKAWNYQYSVLQGVMERLLNRIWRVGPGMCESADWSLLHDNASSHNATPVKQFLAQRKWLCCDCARPPSVFARFNTCWLRFVPESEIPLGKASLWLDFGHPESRDKYIKHHCKGRLLQSHPEAVRPCNSVCTVRRNVCRNINNKNIISLMQIHFIMTVLKLSRRTVQIHCVGRT